MELGRAEEVALKPVEHVTREQRKNGHDQDRLQLFVAGAGAAEVIAGRLVGIILDRQALADLVGCNVLDPLVTEFAVMGLSAIAALVDEPYDVVARGSAEVVVISNPLTRVYRSVRSGP